MANAGDTEIPDEFIEDLLAGDVTENMYEKLKNREFFQRLVRKGIFSDEDLLNQMFINLCEGGNLWAAQLLSTQDGLKKETFQEAFALSCERGHFDVVAWLNDHVDRSAVLSNKCYGVRGAAGLGHVSMVNYLIYHYSLTAEEVDAPELLRTAVRNHCIGLADFLINKFNISLDCLRWVDPYLNVECDAMKMLCWDSSSYYSDKLSSRSRHSEVASWLADRGFKALNQKEVERWLQEALRGRDPDLPRVIADRYDPVLSDPAALFSCCMHGAEGVASWFASRFHFNVESVADEAALWSANLASRGNWTDFSMLVDRLQLNAFSKEAIAVALGLAIGKGHVTFSQRLASLVENDFEEIDLLINYGTALVEAAKNGHAEIVNFILAKDRVTCWDAVRALSRLGESNIGIARDILAKFRDAIVPEIAMNIIRAACGTDSLGLLLVVCETTPYREPLQHLMQAEACRLIQQAAISSSGRNYKVFRWLVENYPVSQEEAHQVLKVCCDLYGSKAARILMAKYQITAADIRATKALPIAIGSGSLKFCKWLVSRFQLKAADAVADDGLALETVKEFNFEDIKTWLEKKFGICFN